MIPFFFLSFTKLGKVLNNVRDLIAVVVAVVVAVASSNEKTMMQLLLVCNLLELMT